MEIIFRDFDDLNPSQVVEIFWLRQQVFIIEQQCLYDDIDGEDSKAKHLLMYHKDKLAAYLRLFPEGIKSKTEAVIGRIVVHPDYRGTGLGHKLMTKGIELCEKSPIRIEAQAHLINYYRQFGFREEGEIYEMDGIDHIQMVHQQISDN